MDNHTPNLTIAQVERYEVRFRTADARLQRHMQQAFQLVRAGESVCILGESGTGKSFLVQDFHGVSQRSGPLVELACPAVHANLFESELFGHMKGSFTGSDRTRVGLIEAADTGVFFLDELADLPLELQAKLLRVVEDGIVRRVGDNEDRKVAVQWITATNADLIELVRQGKFREDLFFRLCSSTIFIPPLRERCADIEFYTRMFLEEGGRAADCLTGEAFNMLHQYSWPGNVRELKSVLRRALILAGDGAVESAHLSFQPRLAKGSGLARVGEDAGVRIGDSLREAEGKLIKATMSAYGGNQSAAADVLGCARGTLANKLQRMKKASQEAEM